MKIPVIRTTGENLKHLMSYEQLLELFKKTFPEYASDIKKWYRVEFIPKDGTMLLVMKNKTGIIYHAKSIIGEDKKIFYEQYANILTSSGIKDYVDFLEQKLEDKTKRNKTVDKTRNTFGSKNETLMFGAE